MATRDDLAAFTTNHVEHTSIDRRSQNVMVLSADCGAFPKMMINSTYAYNQITSIFYATLTILSSTLQSFPKAFLLVFQRRAPQK